MDKTEGFELIISLEDDIEERISTVDLKIDFIKEGEVAYVNVATKLNLRDAPNTNSNIGTLVDDTPVVIKEDLGEWSKIETLGVEGWCFGQYLSLDGDTSATVTTKGSLNIRANCDATATKVIEKTWVMVKK